VGWPFRLSQGLKFEGLGTYVWFLWRFDHEVVILLVFVVVDGRTGAD